MVPSKHWRTVMCFLLSLVSTPLPSDVIAHQINVGRILKTSDNPPSSVKVNVDQPLMHYILLAVVVVVVVPVQTCEDKLSKLFICCWRSCPRPNISKDKQSKHSNCCWA